MSVLLPRKITLVNESGVCVTVQVQCPAGVVRGDEAWIALSGGARPHAACECCGVGSPVQHSTLKVKSARNDLN